VIVGPLDTLLALKAFNVAPDLKATDRRVGAALIEHFNRKSGQCDPGLERLAGLLGISTRTAAGLFRKIRHGGHMNRNKYEPVWSKFREIEAGWNANFHRNARSRMANVSHASSQSCHVQDDSAVTQTCGVNLAKETCLKGRATQAMARNDLERSSTSATDAARAAAERRWTEAIHNRFMSLPVTYGEVIDLITSEMQAAATEAEMRRHGAGFVYILRQLQIPQST
jgi:hypothetical protein